VNIIIIITGAGFFTGTTGTISSARWAKQNWRNKTVNYWLYVDMSCAEVKCFVPASHHIVGIGYLPCLYHDVVWDSTTHVD